jgi:hypothetical protein
MCENTFDLCVNTILRIYGIPSIIATQFRPCNVKLSLCNITIARYVWFHYHIRMRMEQLFPRVTLLMLISHDLNWVATPI